MESNDKILSADLDDLIFENRNKAYGAYFLRRIYNKHLSIAIVISIVVFILFISTPLIIEYIKGVSGASDKVKIVEYTTLAEPPPIDKNEPPPPPVEPPPPLKSTVKFTPPVIKPDEEVTEEAPPTVEELKEVDPGTKTVEGDPEGIDESLLEGSGNELIDEAPTEIFMIVEQMPEFPGGGEEALQKYLYKNIKYPPIARENNITGTVYVSFVINTEGKATNVKVVRDIGGGCGEEAKRVIESMPPWKPGKQNGRPALVQFTIPIKFTLK